MTRSIFEERRRFIQTIISLTSLGMPSIAIGSPITKTIDRRSPNVYSKSTITFSAEKRQVETEIGRFLISWESEEGSEVILTVPADGASRILLIMGHHVDNVDSFVTGFDITASVIIDKELYQLSLSNKKDWREYGSYYMPWESCITRLAVMAKSLRILLSADRWRTPAEFVQDLVNTNS